MPVAVTLRAVQMGSHLSQQLLRFGGRQPTHEELRAMHHEAHEECFIANSVRTEVRWEPIDE